MATAKKQDRNDPLDVGDTLSYSVSASVKHSGQEAWVKVEATTTVHEGETAEETRYRVSDFVHAQIADAIEEIRAS
jgi:hypothetical protein